MNLKCAKAKNWLRDVLKDISSSERTKTYLQDGNKGVITQYNFHRHNIYSHLIQSALSFHFMYPRRRLLCRSKQQKVAQAANRSTAISLTSLFL